MTIKKSISSVFIVIGLLTIIGCEKKITSTKSVVKPTGPIVAKQDVVIAVGESYCGGIIFYVDSTKKHGLIAAANQAIRGRWGCIEKTIGGTSAEIGSGQANTLAIINACDSANCAARICDQLVINGYSDWFLPSRKELDLLYANKAPFRGIKTDYYWSSTESSGIKAECQDFYDGHHMQYEKNKTFYIRAVRAF